MGKCAIIWNASIWILVKAVIEHGISKLAGGIKRALERVLQRRLRLEERNKQQGNALAQDYLVVFLVIND